MKLHPPTPLRRITDPLVIRRFMLKVGTGWVWEGAKDRKGYGRFRLNGSVIAAHRVAYAIFVGDLDDRQIHHRPDQHGVVHPSCVNPDCLEPLGLSENVSEGNRRRRKPVEEDDIPI